MNLEIERKFVIIKPSFTALTEYVGYTRSNIVQTYLASPDGVTHRVRERVYPDRTVYTETKKIRVDRMSSEEYERELTEEEYLALLKSADPERRPVRKTRHTVPYFGRVLEIDVYHEWKKTCIMEIEMLSRDEDVIIPDDIRILLEVTGDARYSNAAMAKTFPEELI